MGRGRTGAALIGAAVALMVGGSVASAGPDPSVPEPSAPETSAPETSAPEVTAPIESSVPPTESSVPAESETYMISVSIDADEDFLIARGARVALHDPGAADPLSAAMPCTSVPVCQRFEAQPGEYRVTFAIENSDEGAYFLIREDGSPGMSFDFSVVDRDVELLFGVGGIGTPPTTSSTTSTVAAAGPVPVAELPETGGNGRLGIASFVLIAVGLGCVVAARRRPA